MKKILLALMFACLLPLSPAQAEVTFHPSLDLGVGWQVYEHDDAEDENYFYGTIKSYLLRAPGSVLGFKLLGVGYGLNTNGDSQLILSPVRMSILNIVNISPDYGVGLGDAPNYWGISIGIGF
jgi:hypothetical protein